MTEARVWNDPHVPRLARSDDVRTTYPEVGATAGDLPPGYHHVHESQQIGVGRAAFERAFVSLMSWQMHDRAGVHQVAGPPTAVEGRDVAFRWIAMRFECRVISVVHEENRRGFTYGTLARHPECGEERFIVEFGTASESVAATITAFSKPSNALIRLAGPLPRFIQGLMTQRYLKSLT